MTKKEMLKEMIGCETCKAKTEAVRGWYHEWMRIKENPNIVRSVKEWQSWARYRLGAK